VSRGISMFTATADLEVALTILSQTALGLSREVRRAPLSQCREILSTEDANRALRRLATALSIDASRLPPADSIAQMFDDELLSMKALKLHRGRNVYSAGKLALWESLWVPFQQALSPDPATLDLLTELVAWRTVQGHLDLTRCADALTARLTALGFDVQRVERAGHAPLLVARREARNLAGRLVMYNHYDAAETDAAAWVSDPWTLTEREGRLYGRAVGDNKAAVAQRLVTLAGLDASPEIVWILQGEEECESPLAHEVVPELLRGLTATLWLEENGYFDPNGTQRMLARVIGAAGESETPDAALDQIVRTLGDDAATWGSAQRLEVRGLNKDFFARGCPFNRALPAGARYLAIGVNDPASTIHRPNESVPVWTLALHARQFATVLRQVDRVARAG